MINELAHAGPDHLDPVGIDGYDRKQGHPDPAEDLSIFAAHGLVATSTIVDLGAGTGQFAIPAAQRFGRVIAVDISPAMIDVLRDRGASSGLENLDCVQAGFLSYRHLGSPADGVHTRNALHHLPDFWKGLALERIAAIVRPGGVLRIHDLIYDFQPSEAGEVLEKLLAQAGDDPAVGYTDADLEEHIRSEYSTYRWLFEPMLAAAGFEIVTVDYRLNVYGAYTCMKA